MAPCTVQDDRHPMMAATRFKMETKAVLAVLTLFLLSGCTHNSQPSTEDRSAVVAAQTRGGAWTIGARTLPVPGGASDALREAIATAGRRRRCT